MVIAYGLLLQIKWNNRLIGDTGKTCKITVDGTDCPINEPQPFSSKWFSHKFKSAGLRYEVGICIKTGSIVWAYGPFPCGSYSDLRIFRRQLKGKLLLAGKMCEADLGYRGEPTTIRTPHDYVSRSNQHAKKKARARHETVNGLLKDWSVLHHYETLFEFVFFYLIGAVLFVRIS